MPKFKYGDKVQVNGHKGTITRVVRKHSGDYICTVTFDDSNLIPPFMDFPENHIKPDHSSRPKYEYDRRFSYRSIMNKDKYCPICSNEWHEMENPFLGKKDIWKDCRTCNKSYKQIMKEIENEN